MFPNVLNDELQSLFHRFPRSLHLRGGRYCGGWVWRWHLKGYKHLDGIAKLLLQLRSGGAMHRG
jgi:hypothetical protein